MSFSISAKSYSLQIPNRFRILHYLKKKSVLIQYYYILLITDNANINALILRKEKKKLFAISNNYIILYRT